MKTKKIFNAVVIVLVLIVGCCILFSEEENRHFNSPSEAITACQKELYNLKKKKKATTSTLIKHINRWMAIRDSSFSCFVNADSTQMNTKVFNQFYAVSDSIGNEILRLSASYPKTVEDLVEIQVETAANKKEIQRSQNLKNATEYYKNIKEAEPEITLKDALAKYKTLANKTNKIKKEQELLKFIQEEDIYYQVIMRNLQKVDTHDLETISHDSEKFFSRLMYSLTIENNEDNKRILTYLYMRVNRRVITNIKAVCDVIHSNVKLNESQIVTFRIMLLNPYLSLNSESWAYMTKDQIKVLEDLAPKLHEYLLKLDGVKNIKENKEAEELENNIGKYLTTAYLKQLL